MNKVSNVYITVARTSLYSISNMNHLLDRDVIVVTVVGIMSIQETLLALEKKGDEVRSLVAKTLNIENENTLFWAIFAEKASFFPIIRSSNAPSDIP